MVSGSSTGAKKEPRRASKGTSFDGNNPSEEDDQMENEPIEEDVGSEDDLSSGDEQLDTEEQNIEDSNTLGNEWTFIEKRRKRGKAVVFEAEDDGNFAEGDFNKICDSIRAAVTGPVKEPRFTKNGGLVIECADLQDMENLKTLSSLGGVLVKAKEVLPKAECKCKLKGVHPSFSESMILNTLRPVGVKHVVRVKSTNHLTGITSNSDQIIITFDTDRPPSQVVLGLKTHAVLIYHEPLQCFNCYQYGHTRASCAGATICKKCGLSGHVSTECVVKTLCCVNCKGSHSPQFGGCPVRLKIVESLKRAYSVPAGSRCAPIPVCAPVPDIRADTNFSAKSYAGVVRNGISSSSFTQRPFVETRTRGTDGRPEVTTVSAAPSISEDEMVERLFAKLVPRFEAVIERLIDRVFSRLLPRLISAMSAHGSGTLSLLTEAPVSTEESPIGESPIGSETTRSSSGKTGHFKNKQC